MSAYQFIDNEGSFILKNAENYSGLYFPIAGEHGIKGAVTPNFGGDAKLDQNSFLLEPVSIENLHNNRSTRNFWCKVEGVGTWSVTGASAEEESKKFTKEQDESELKAGFLYQTVTRRSKKYQLESKVTSFVPVDHVDVEIMQVEIRNVSDTTQKIVPTAAIPLYGRSADNIRDHRHVTSLLHRIQTTTNGVTVKPTLSFDERGHQKNNTTYYVLGVTGDGENPVDFYPVAEEYLGEGGTYTHPRAVLSNQQGVPAGEAKEGKEALGGIHFAEAELKPNEAKTYTLLMGISRDKLEEKELVKAYDNSQKVEAALEKTKAYWKEKLNIRCQTGNPEFDQYMLWVSFQPMLRRIYGCSFLPHHDYGKGGRGWRDLWQDCLALLLMNPQGVRKMLLDNFGGVRMDGTNATIIGDQPGVFIADRNHITRVWMDHGVWPYITTKLYIDQTGDIEIFGEKVTYFKDAQIERGTKHDDEWSEAYGNQQKTANGEVYSGTVLEHLLLETLCAFYEVGEHNHIRMRGADWNDALDMAEKNGESVAFTSAYAGNLNSLAECIKVYSEKTGAKTISVAAEMALLFADDAAAYDDINKKREVLAAYVSQCRHNISGEKVELNVDAVVESLKHKADWIMEHIRKTEWVSDEQGNGWFNGYYDNSGRQVEGSFPSGARMMLTGQVFTIMSQTAKEEQVEAIAKSADQYLYQKETGGYRLNTNFHEVKEDLGRMFGFAYGEKENGAVFSHMAVMYANALYQRGFVKEGYKALQTLADASMNFDVSYIYPGVPEYFNANGRGLYHYLTGAASWYMLTMVTEVFGVRGTVGDLLLEPKLMKQQFDADGNANVKLVFAGRNLSIRYVNAKQLEYGEYKIQKVTCVGNELFAGNESKVAIARNVIEAMNEDENEITVVLG